MKKIILLFSAFVILMPLRAQNKGGQFYYLGEEMFITGISPNGEYVVGYRGYGDYSLVWTETDGLQAIDEGGTGSMAYAIANNGVFVGQFYDENIMYENWDGELCPLFSAGYYANGQWTGLGVKPEIMTSPEGFGSMAEGISADGTKIGGSMYYPTWILEPTIWTNGSSPTALEVELIGQGGRVQGMSGDGTVTCGWVAPQSKRLPAFWINGTLHIITINGMIAGGEALNVSANGRYVSLEIDGKAAIYDIQEAELIVIGKADGMMSSSATAVSDEGIVVGYNTITFGMDREPFIYSERFGMINLNQYLNDMGINDALYANMATPMGISSDGKRIVGFGNDLSGFVVDVNEHLTGVYPAKNLIATESMFRAVDLSWNAPKTDASNTLTGYNVYRNGTKINAAIVSETTYTDNLTANGTYYYTVKAVWNQDQESVATAQAKINSGNKSLPFMETFESLSLDANYWTTTTGAETRWRISEYDGILAPCIVYYNLCGDYNESLSTPFFNATDTEDLFLAFNIAKPTEADENFRNFLNVEVYDGTQWHTIAEFDPLFNEWGAFTHHKYDISSIAANKDNIRVRFTASGNNSVDNLSWAIDNVNVYESKDEFLIYAPTRIFAHKFDDGTVHVNWTNPGSIAELSYLEYEDLYDMIGNEGVPFIAAAKYDAKDLIGYYDYELYAVSALIVTEAMATPNTLRLAVFQGTQRIVDQAIDSYKFGWNTFELNEPIVLNVNMTEPIYFGIEVVSHGVNDLPIGVCDRPIIDWETGIYAHEGESNIYSEDGGQTWGTLTEFDIYFSCGVKANIRKNHYAKPMERLIGYKLYRDGESILGEDWLGNDNLTAMNRYLDMEPSANETACYEVSAYYTSQEESTTVKFCLGDVITSIEDYQGNADLYQVFPNPANDIINVEGKFDYITIFDTNGRIIMNTSNKQVNVSNLPKGVYFMKIQSAIAAPVVKKILKN